MHAPQYILATTQVLIFVACAWPIRPLSERLTTIVMLALNVALMFWGGFYPNPF